MTSLVNHSVTNLINGVSEQAPSVRLDNQMEEQINCYSDVTRGLTKRNGLELKKITALDIADTFKVAFTFDGNRHMIALDGDSVSPIKYVPLSADVDALAVAISDEEYFQDMDRTDLQVIEDKDFVYLLNKRQIVGEGTNKSTYFDIKVREDSSSITATTWIDGQYTLKFDSQADPTTTNVATGTVSVIITRATTIASIAASINANATFVAQSGLCTIAGNVSNYRITFNQVPTGWIFPLITKTLNVAIKRDFVAETYSGFIFTNGGDRVDVVNVSPGNTLTYFWFGGILLNSGGFPNYSPSSWTDPSTGYEYNRGQFTQQTNQSGTLIDQYSISQLIKTPTNSPYTVSTSSPSTTQVDGEGLVEYATQGMSWITGVSANQTYDMEIKYFDIATPTTILTFNMTQVAVGATVSNINLNWVAGQVTANMTGVVSGIQFENAILISTTGNYALKSITTSNNYDITSISGVIEAKDNNEDGVQVITNLPPTFYDDFKLRVSTTDEDKSNFYMKYDSEFKGWKEAALNESRFLDRTTMPFIIDKSKIAATGIITIEPNVWTQSLSGDDVSNKEPSFVGRTINDLFFYGSRLGLATDDTLIMSGIDDPAMFFRTTTSQIKKSDRVDIKLDSTKIGYSSIKHVITYDGKLFINTGSNQSILLVNTAFDLTSARLTEVSSYSLGDSRPIPVGGGLYFANTTRDITNVFNYIPSGNGVYEAIDMTKHCPRFIKGEFKDMDYSSDFTVVSTFDDSKTLYVQNRFSQGGQLVQNAWHKWTVPYDIEHFYFYENTLYIIMSTTDSLAAKQTIVTQYSLRPQDVQNDVENVYIGWRPLIDCYTKDSTLVTNFTEFTGVNDRNGQSFATSALAYASTERTQNDLGAVDGPYLEKVTPPLYYWNVVGDLNTIVFNGAAAIIFGNSTLDYFDSGGFRYYKGDTDDGFGYFEISRAAITTTVLHEDEMLYGIPYTAKVTLSQIVPRQQADTGITVLNYATLMLRRMRVLLNKSGLFNVTIDFKDRTDFTVKYTGLPLGTFVTGRGTVSDINFNFPINAKADRISITIETVDSTPFNLLATEWQGQLITKGRNI